MNTTSFPFAGFEFLAELREHNSREWFEQNRDRFERDVWAPATSIVAAIGSELAERHPPVGWDPRRSGGSLMRIHRDTRFSADKRPYKHNVAMMFVEPGRGKMAAPGFGLQITPDHAELVVGQFVFTPSQLAQYRASVTGPEGASLLDTLASIPGALSNGVPYRLDPPALKRVPRGYPPDGPAADLMRHKGLALFSPVIDRTTVASESFVPTVLAHFDAMAPLWRWLQECVP